ncbi:MAG: hypothetical protein KGH57_00570 [Candidatus Micrarchaeota archaeon]|nr:hypothetical protein [Candidatus Micrarchaeota archaeon]
MQKSYCIICGKERSGIAVENDTVLGSIRWFKANVTKDEKNNRLVVCKECYPKYSAGRAKFESRQKLYIGLGFVFAALNILIARNLASLVVSIFIVLLLFALSFLSYMPRINIKKQHNQ